MRETERVRTIGLFGHSKCGKTILAGYPVVDVKVSLKEIIAASARKEG